MKAQMNLIVAAVLCLLGSAAYAQNPPQRTVPSARRPVPQPRPGNSAGGFLEDIIRKAMEEENANLPIETYYNINSNVGGGVVLDSTWARESIEDLIDDSFEATVPRIDDAHMPPKPTRENPDPFKDNTKAILHSETTYSGNIGSFENASQYKEALAIELVGYSKRVPKDLLEPVRLSMEVGATSRGWHYVLDAQTVLGGKYDGSPVYYGGNSGRFHFTPRMDALYCAGVRYVISAFVSQYYTHSYYSSPTAKYPTYESAITVHITCYDLDCKEILETQVMTVYGTGSTQAKADDTALSSISWKTSNMIERNFPMVINMTGLGEPDKKGKIHECTVDYGAAFAARNTDNFYVFLKEADGRYTRLGRIRVTTVTGEDSSTCKIASGQEKIAQAFDAGCTLVVYSLDQQIR